MTKLKVLLSITVCIGCIHNILSQDIEVDFTKKKQTVTYMGINMEGYHTTGGNDILKNSVSEMLSSLPVNADRIGLPLKEWELENDNESAGVIEGAGFSTTAVLISNSFKRLVRMKNQNLTIWLSIWDMADWNIQNPEQGNNRCIRSLDEMAESIVAYLKIAKEEYGVEVKWISINEPTIATETGYGGYNIGMSVEEQVDLIKKSSKLFRENNIKTTWIVAVHSVYPSELRQAQLMFEEVKDLVSGFDFHSYWLQNKERYEDVKAWGDWISTTGMPAYCGELDYDNNFWKRTADDKKIWITHGMITSQLYALICNTARASGSFPWYANRPDQITPYRYVALHYHAHILPGYRVVETSVLDPALSIVAAENEQDWVMIVQNNSSLRKVVKIKGGIGNSAQVVTSYNNNYGIKKEDISITNGEIHLQMEPYSLYSLGSNLEPLPSVVVTAGGNEEIPENYMEAEDGIVGAGSSFDDSQPGYKGIGYIDFGGKDSWTQFDLFFDKEGTYDFYARYACGSKRPCDFFLNGELVNSYSFESTGSFTKWSEVSIPVTFNAGKNTVRLVANTSSGGPNIDSYRWDIISGLSNVEHKGCFLYPNPASDKVYIRGCEDADILKIFFFDLSGRIIFSSFLDTFKRDIDISFLMPGCYWVKICDINKRKNFIHRLIKKS